MDQRPPTYRPRISGDIADAIDRWALDHMQTHCRSRAAAVNELLVRALRQRPVDGSRHPRSLSEETL
jgi:hypothetical protein